MIWQNCPLTGLIYRVGIQSADNPRQTLTQAALLGSTLCKKGRFFYLRQLSCNVFLESSDTLIQQLSNLSGYDQVIFPLEILLGIPFPVFLNFLCRLFQLFFSVPLMMVFTGFLSLATQGFDCMHPGVFSYLHSFGLHFSSSLVKMPSPCKAVCYLMMDNINIISTSNGIYIQMRKEKKSY